MILREINCSWLQKVKNYSLNNFEGFQFWFLEKYHTRKCQKSSKIQNSEVLKWSKWQLLGFQNDQNWFHAKSKWQKNPEISTLCIPNLAAQVCRIVTFAVIYPYIHLSGENSITKEDILPYAGPECKEWVDQAFYIEIDHVPSKNSFSIKELDYVIFIGVQAHADALSSKIGRAQCSLEPEKVTDAQCENFMIFLSLHSYFAWNQFWWFQKCKICHFNTFGTPEFWFLWNLASFRSWNLSN